LSAVWPRWVFCTIAVPGEPTHNCAMGHRFHRPTLENQFTRSRLAHQESASAGVHSGGPWIGPGWAPGGPRSHRRHQSRRPTPRELWRTDNAAMDLSGGLWAEAGQSPRCPRIFLMTASFWIKAISVRLVDTTVIARRRSFPIAEFYVRWELLVRFRQFVTSVLEEPNLLRRSQVFELRTRFPLTPDREG
jgi:hypothetical protein